METTATTRPAPLRRAVSVPANSMRLSASVPLRQASVGHGSTSVGRTATTGIVPRKNYHRNGDNNRVPLHILCDQLPTREYDDISRCSDITFGERTIRKDHASESETDEPDDVMSMSDCYSQHHGFENMHNLIEEVLRDKIQPTPLFGVTDLRVVSRTLSEGSAQSQFSTASQVVFFEDESRSSFAGSREVLYANTLQHRTSDNRHREEEAVVWQRPSSLLHVGWTFPTERVEF